MLFSLHSNLNLGCHKLKFPDNVSTFIGVLYEERWENNVKIDLNQNKLTCKGWSYPNKESAGAENLIVDSEGLMYSVNFLWFEKMIQYTRMFVKRNCFKKLDFQIAKNFRNSSIGEI